MTGSENKKSNHKSADAETSEAGDSAERRCVQCGKPAVHAYRPFCSRRCADLDLARWLGGRYAIAAKPEFDEEDWPEVAPNGARGSNDKSDLH